MKHVLFIMVLTVAVAGFGARKGLVEEVSGQGYGAAGCGLGSILFGSKPGFIPYRDTFSDWARPGS